MLEILFMVFVVANTFGPDKPLDDRRKTRQMQNKEAAKKSYETKKKEREYLQQKNAQLEKAQKALLLSKCELELVLRRLQHIAAAMIHANSTCKSRTEEATKLQSNISENNQSNPDVNTCYPLDLSVKSKRPICQQDTLFTHSQHSPGYINEADHVPYVNKSNNHLVRAVISSMNMTATLEVDSSESVSNKNKVQDNDKLYIKREIDIKQEVDIVSSPMEIKLETVD